MIAAATGHRPNKLGNEYDLCGPHTDFIKGEIFKWLSANKPEKIISGMALGVDQIWAICGIRKDIPVIAAIPCTKQESRWPKKSIDLYNSILSYGLVEKHFVSLENYTHECMQKRNRWMVDNRDVLVAVWNGSPGGTANCVKYAREVNKQVFMINIDSEARS